jgi:phosphatidylglycerol---prolipoprotein diacylglyceryl transferase
MYPNLHFALKDWFGIDWQWTKIFNSFGLLMAMAFVVAAIVVQREFKRRRLNGTFNAIVEKNTYGLPLDYKELIVQFIVGFLIGYKILGGIVDGDMMNDAQAYISSKKGNVFTGILLGAFFVFLKWSDKQKELKRFPKPTTVAENVWPERRVSEIIFLGAIFGLIGAKLFHFFENWSSFIKDPIGNITSPAGLTFYGGLILAAIAILYYTNSKKIHWKHVVDSCAPALMIAYAVGRLGCQVSGDGDWGIYNSAYTTTPQGKVELADTNNNLNKVMAIDKSKTLTLSGRPHFDYDIKEFGKVLHKPYIAPSYLPTWMVAMNYAHNVNEEGWIIENSKEKYQTALPTPVYPTPFYELVMCTFLFLVLWAIRKKITVPGVLFGIYLMMNGAERFLIEQIRVNTRYHFMGLHPSQAEIISTILFLSGIAVILYSRKTNNLKTT